MTDRKLTAPAAAKPAVLTKRIKPNRNTIGGIRPHGYKEKTKSEMQADLKKAVENTK